MQQTQRLTDLGKGMLPCRRDSESRAVLQLWTLPTHVTGWVSASLATSSLLRAVGVGSSAIPATTMAAAIKWITKDGVGAIGRLIVGGRLGLFIDEDPRLWRMAAEAVSTVGLSLEIGTVFFPTHFLLLAGTGNFAKALAKGMSKPAFRVIQQHFARNNNIGEVSAKEESWEVAGQMTGILTSVAILTALQESPSWQPVLVTWAAFHSVHIFCRFFALQTLEFDSLNLTRAQKLISLHISQQRVAAPDAISREERFLTDWVQERPSIEFGSSLKTAAVHFSHSGFFGPWVSLFQEEGFLLTVQEGRGSVVLKQGHSSFTCLKALWQFLWLQHHGISTPGLDHIQQSLTQTNLHFPDFISQATKAGWNPQNLLFRLGTARVSRMEL